MKITILGDFHGVPGAVHNANHFARKHECAFIIQCGDFACYQQPSEVPLYWCRGNHENWSVIGRHKNGQYELADGLYYVDDWSTRHFDSSVFGFIGGIQKTHWHLNNRAKVGGYKRSTNPAGIVTTDHSKPEDRLWIERDDEQIQRFEQEGIDVLVLHDEPRGPADNGWLVPAVKQIQPGLVVHGHMHHHYINEIDGIDVVCLPPADTTMWFDQREGRHNTDTVGVIYDTETQDWWIEETSIEQL